MSTDLNSYIDIFFNRIEEIKERQTQIENYFISTIDEVETHLHSLVSVYVADLRAKHSVGSVEGCNILDENNVISSGRLLINKTEYELSMLKIHAKKMQQMTNIMNCFTAKSKMIDQDETDEAEEWNGLRDNTNNNNSYDNDHDNNSNSNSNSNSPTTSVETNSFSTQN